MSYTPGPWYATTRQGSWDWVVARDANNEVCQMFHDGTEFNETGEAHAELAQFVAALADKDREIAALKVALRKLSLKSGMTENR